MRYAQIRSMDISNGLGIGVALFVQGCHFHCKNCFNEIAWGFSGGKEWTPEDEVKFFSLIDRPYIERVSFLGGEPLEEENLGTLLALIATIKTHRPDKKIWLYTGYRREDLLRDKSQLGLTRIAVLDLCDYVVDGQYIDALKDQKLRFRGSSNQIVWHHEDDQWEDVSDTI